MTDELPDVAAPSCPQHLEALLAVGDDPEGRDARWVCPIEDCKWAQIT